MVSLVTLARLLALTAPISIRSEPLKRQFHCV